MKKNIVLTMTAFSIVAICLGLVVCSTADVSAGLNHLTQQEVQSYKQISPFELKNNLIDAANKACAKAQAAGQACKMLNAGRGNPNFVNTTARQAFAHLSMFSIQLAGARTNISDLGFRPLKQGIAQKLNEYLGKNAQDQGGAFLKQAIAYAEKELKLDADELVFELADNALGDFYPSPPRISVNNEKIVNAYLNQILLANNPPPGKFHLFATEGATAAMIYTFKSLRENKILNAGDRIAIITPIFSPYLEIPGLNDYQLVSIYVEGNEALGWQVPDSELEKLKDPSIKALYLVNPTNPTSVSLQKSSIDKIAKLIQEKRKNLIILTDTVYATFVDEYHSLIKEIPQNTICVYSYSKYFGVTGWRLGVIMLHEDNVIDRLIANLPKETKAALAKRYGIDSTQPETIKFIDRMVMDSRDVALAHTGGLSGPQQAIMSLLSLFNLVDKTHAYKKSIHDVLNKRINNLYTNLGIKPPEGPDQTHYYALIDLEKMAREKYGKKFADDLTKKYSAIDFLFNLANQKYSICLPGAGFAGPEWSIRVSLANLYDDAYIAIGKGISNIMQQYHDEWKTKLKGS